MTLIASPFLKKGLAMTMTNEGEAVPAARFAHRRPPHPSRNFNVKMMKIVKAAVPPPSPLFFKREGRGDKHFKPLFPLSNSLREGELKGVSEN
jgi:hypothetical protein